MGADDRQEGLHIILILDWMWCSMQAFSYFREKKMAGITLVQAEAQLEAYLSASLKIAQGQEYEMDGRKLKRADLGYVQQQIRYWDGMVKRLSKTTRRAFVPDI